MRLEQAFAAVLLAVSVAMFSVMARTPVESRQETPFAIHEQRSIDPGFAATCGGTDGEHCGCESVNCVEPCSVCCETVPCPIGDPSCE